MWVSSYAPRCGESMSFMATVKKVYIEHTYILVPLDMCAHITAYVSNMLKHTCILILLHMCAQTTTYVSNMLEHTCIVVLLDIRYVCSYYYICQQ